MWGAVKFPAERMQSAPLNRIIVYPSWTKTAPVRCLLRWGNVGVVVKPGPRPQSSILRLIRGDRHTERLKDDRPKVDAPPEVPPDSRLTPAEQRQWDWLVRTVYLPGVHGASDGAAFLRVARLLARVNEVDARIAQQGLLMKSPVTGKPELQPYTRLSRDLWQQLGVALNDLGMSPGARVRLASPRIGAMDNPNGWDDID